MRIIFGLYKTCFSTTQKLHSLKNVCLLSYTIDTICIQCMCPLYPINILYAINLCTLAAFCSKIPLATGCRDARRDSIMSVWECVTKSRRRRRGRRRGCCWDCQQQNSTTFIYVLKEMKWTEKKRKEEKRKGKNGKKQQSCCHCKSSHCNQ